MASKGRRFADDGWAFWVDGDDTSTVYLSEWINPRGRNYVDVAVRIRGILASGMLNIYAPFRLSKWEIEDISLKLNDRNFLCALFSSTCLIYFKKNESTSEVAYNGKTIDIVHISHTDYGVRALDKGSLITVDLVALRPRLANDEAYIIFRIPHKSLNEVFASKTSVGSFFVRLRDLVLSPVLSERYGYSVRINEGRMLPEAITRIGAFHRQKLKKAVVALSVSEDYEVKDSNCYRIRRLEEDLYRDFVPRDFDCRNVITYQFRQSRVDNLRGHFNFYFDMARESISQSSMFIYVVILVIVGVAGEGFWELIKLAAQALAG